MAVLPRLLGSRVERGALLVAAVLEVAIGFVPQFGGPGYESALAGGLILPSIAAIATALLVSSATANSQLPTANSFDALGRGIAFGAVLALLGAAIAKLHGLRSGFCDAPLGYKFWATGPGPGAVMGGASGAGLFAARFRRVRW